MGPGSDPYRAEIRRLASHGLRSWRSSIPRTAAGTFSGQPSAVALKLPSGFFFASWKPRIPRQKSMRQIAVPEYEPSRTGVGCEQERRVDMFVGVSSSTEESDFCYVMFTEGTICMQVACQSEIAGEDAARSRTAGAETVILAGDSTCATPRPAKMTAAAPSMSLFQTHATSHLERPLFENDGRLFPLLRQNLGNWRP